MSPDTDEPVTQEDVENTKKFFSERFGGPNRGSTAVMSAKTKVQIISWSPEQMNLKGLRRIPEERISAALGVPAIVAGLGAGLDRSTFANFQEARRHAYESNIIPMQRLIGGEIERSLIPDFISEAIDDPARFMVAFNIANVRVMREDSKAHSERAISEFLAGARTRAETRTGAGSPGGRCGRDLPRASEHAGSAAGNERV